MSFVAVSINSISTACEHIKVRLLFFDTPHIMRTFLNDISGGAVAPLGFSPPPIRYGKRQI